MNNSTTSAAEQEKAMRQYYRFHAAIYDATRWVFLFGRNRILSFLPQIPAQTLVEVGCGTGRNLQKIAKKHKGWNLIGIDVSPEMLHQASKRTEAFSHQVLLLKNPYGSSTFRLQEPVDIVLFSYALTMFNPGWEAAIEQAWEHLKPGGRIAVVDFHDTPFAWFRRWMGYNHVRMDQHLLPVLENRFHLIAKDVCLGWCGLWRYFLYVGEKNATPQPSGNHSPTIHPSTLPIGNLIST
ncbi:MAG: class I SAM-dependent methyltransferase [Saprospiraceae bacterium]